MNSPSITVRGAAVFAALVAATAFMSESGVVVTTRAASETSWDAALRAEAPAETRRDNGRVFRSSSRLQVSFAPVQGDVDHYRVAARERGGRILRTSRVAAGGSGATLEGLPAGTQFSIDVTACRDAVCSSTVAAMSNDRVTAATEDEIWQIQASGDSINQAVKIVSDGNVKIHATRFGPEAPAEVRGRVQIYYGPMTQSAKGLAVGVSEAVASSDPASVLYFTSMAGSTGLVSPNPDATLVADVATGQAVPLASGITRLFFEALGADGRTRIMHLDSQDGFVGRDFHQGAATVCSTAADYSAGRSLRAGPRCVDRERPRW
jgi:hypothetical protein